jgi:hypothetical protein
MATFRMPVATPGTGYEKFMATAGEKHGMLVISTLRRRESAGYPGEASIP